MTELTIKGSAEDISTLLDILRDMDLRGDVVLDGLLEILLDGEPVLCNPWTIY